jgi:YrbI family 3-deoxy-D-manno-octulosonate 8-phosphate phosphatase
VFVSTDDEEIATLSLDAGAFVRYRPTELCGDDVSSEGVLLDVMRNCCVTDGVGDVIVFMQCTSPLTLPVDVKRCIVIASNDGCAVTAVRFHGLVWHENHWTGRYIGINHDESTRLRRQDMPLQWQETGAVYAFTASAFLRARTRFCGEVVFVEQQPWQAVDIDDGTDLVVADALARAHDWYPDMSRFKLLVLDFDGVLTDRKVHFDSDGREMLTCSKEDSTGIFELQRAGVPVVVLTHEMDRGVVKRCEKLRVECWQTDRPKEQGIEGIASVVGNVPLSAVAYVGDDYPDAATMRLVGLAMCPADAHESAKHAADIVLSRNGGDGAVREACDMLLAGRKR